MIRVIQHKLTREHGVWLLDADGNHTAMLAIHKREKVALALARCALMNAVMAVEQKERKLK